ncbi:MAG: hypothetical protein HC809_11820 [Gammaproteobacteria bacterium]|nr:hypothetical protein [Gammaproteobacteria bacterium]
MSVSTQVPAAPDDVRLYVLDCGRIGLDDVSSFGLTNAETPVRELFVPCYLIVIRRVPCSGMRDCRSTWWVKV